MSPDGRGRCPADEQTTQERGRTRAASRAVAPKAVLPEVGEDLTPGERALLPELLDRLADPAR